jgi:hypothetical protein
MTEPTPTQPLIRSPHSTWGPGSAGDNIANHCSAAQAECLTRIRKEGLYKALNLTWDEFCKQHAGASRAHADEIIRRLEEFGAALQTFLRYTSNKLKRLGRNPLESSRTT